MTRVARMLALGAVAMGVLPYAATAVAQTTAFEEVRTLTRGPEPVTRDFTIAAAGVYRLTLTDLAVPAAFGTLQAAVTRGDTVVATLDAPGSIDVNASTAGSYTLRVVGVPAASAGAGSFGVRLVNPSAGDAVVLEFADAIDSPPPAVPPNRRVLETTFEVTAAGTYEVLLSDHAFPAVLSTLTLAIVRDGGTALDATLAAAGAASFPATPGRYRLLVIGESPAATNAGAFGVRVRNAATLVPVYSLTTPVGLVRESTLPPLLAGAHTLQVADLAFPAALVSAGALLTAGADALARRDMPGSAPFTAADGEHQLLTLGIASAAAPGALGVDLRRGTAGVLSVVLTAPATDATATVQAFNYAIDVTNAGAYRLRLADFDFPQPLLAKGIAATQGGVLLGSLNAAGTLELGAVAAGKLFVVVLAQPAGTGSGLLGLDLAPAGAGATPLFERTEGIGTLFFGRAVDIATAGEYQVTLTDLRFPAQFDELAAVVTRGADRLGSVFAGGTFPFTATPGTYNMSVVARTSPTAVYGTYGLRVSTRPPAPSVTFAADATSVANGGTAMLTWSSTGATACSATGGWSGARAASGSERTAPITTSTTFTLNCDGPGGQRAASVTVSPRAASSGGGGGGGGRLDFVLLTVLVLALCAAGLRRAQFAAGRGHAFRTLFVALALGAATGAPAADDVVASAVSATSAKQAVDDRAYRIQPGDVLAVAVWKERDLQGDILVRPDGGISFPLAGDLPAGGKTVAQLADSLAEKLQRYIPDPVVTVTVKAIGGNRIYVLGKVNRPGEFPFSQPLDVMQALALAGGATSFAAVNDIRILRRVDNRLTAVEFHYADVERGRKLEQNIVLRSGDTVVVP